MIDGTLIDDLFETEPGKIHIYLGFSDFYTDLYVDMTPTSILRARTSLVSSNWVLQSLEAAQATHDTRYVKVGEAYTTADSLMRASFNPVPCSHL